jgi:uncharacterized protein YodC (DUF2158 family)
MAQALKIGDVVQLSSGGPKMTVATLQSDGAGTVRCVWFSPDGKLDSAALPVDVLRPSKGK